MKGWQDGKWEVPKWEFDGKPALLIMHMQQGSRVPGRSPALRTSRKRNPSKRARFSITKKLLKAFRQKKLPIIFVSVVPNPIGFLPKWGFIFEMSRQKAPVGRLDNPALKAGTDLIPELDRQPGEYLLHHTGICAFTGSHLNDVLKHHEVHDLVLAGYTAHSTVYNAVVQAVDNWYSSRGCA